VGAAGKKNSGNHHHHHHHHLCQVSDFCKRDEVWNRETMKLVWNRDDETRPDFSPEGL
jgi:hypothetical protein